MTAPPEAKCPERYRRLPGRRWERASEPSKDRPPSAAPSGSPRWPRRVWDAWSRRRNPLAHRVVRAQRLLQCERAEAEENRAAAAAHGGAEGRNRPEHRDLGDRYRDQSRWDAEAAGSRCRRPRAAVVHRDAAAEVVAGRRGVEEGRPSVAAAVRAGDFARWAESWRSHAARPRASESVFRQAVSVLRYRRGKNRRRMWMRSAPSGWCGRRPASAINPRRRNELHRERDPPTGPRAEK